MGQRGLKQEAQLTPSKSAQLFSATMQRTSSKRKQRNLTNVWNALEHLRDVKSPDFTAASVARTIEAMKLSGPKAQSIRNVEGQDFREIIRAYSAEYGGTNSKKNEYSEPDEFLFGIADLRTAAKVRELLADDRSKGRQINLLKNFISNLAPVELNPDGSLAAPVVKELARSPVHPEFSPMEIDSVVSFLKAIEESGECLSLRFDPTSGALLWKEGVLEVAGPGFLHALSKIADKEG
jgi:hypothetical protein